MVEFSDSKVPKTTALVDLINKEVTLPVDPVNFICRDLSVAQITGTSSGIEQPVSGMNLRDLLTDQTWMTQVLSGGGGASFTVEIYFPEAVKTTRIEYEVTHKQSVVVSVLVGVNWIPLNGEQEILGVRLVLGRSMGISSGDQFIYTFGLKSVHILSCSYVPTATLTTLKLDIPRNDISISSVLLDVDAILPPGTSITYEATLGDESFPVLNLVPGMITPIGSSIHTEEIIYVPGTEDVTFQYGRPLQLATLTNETRLDTILKKPGNGIFVGDGQWYVESYNYDWSFRPKHTPGPADWVDLSEKGVAKKEISKFYVDIFRGNWYKDLTRTSISGTGTALTSLVDMAADFVTDEIAAGDLVYFIADDGTISYRNVAAVTDLNTLALDASYAISTSGSYEIIPGIPILVNSKYRFDLLNGRDPSGRYEEGFSFEAFTTYKFTTWIYAKDDFSFVTPSVGSRVSRDSALLTGMKDITELPSTQEDSDIWLTVYVNSNVIAKSSSGVNWVFQKGWNEITVYACCAEDYATPISLGISLSPESFPLLSTATSTLTSNVDLTLSDEGLAYISYDLDSSGNPLKNIQYVRASLNGLDQTSLFDLQYNTPILYNGRYSMLYSPDIRVYLPVNPTARVTARYDTVDDGVQPDNISLEIGLSTVDTSVRPILSGYTLSFF